jgi:DNA-binding LacI/PurR family transcriptional regulator
VDPSDPKERVTLRDVARKLNVSHTTVSRALRDDTQISESMRQRVQRVAQELGYRPDPMLAALAHYRQGRTRAPICAELAWINHWHEPQRLRSFREFDLYWKGASAEAERCGFRLEEFVLDERISSSRLEKILRARNIRGILIPPHGDFAPDWGDFHWNDFCVVRFGHSVSSPRAHLVTSDQLTDGLIAFENIWKNGYRRVGLVTSTKSHTRFSAGFFFAQMKWSPEFQLPALVLAQDQREADQRRLTSWLRKLSPDAIFTDVRELHDLLMKAGYVVPQDIGLAAMSVLDGNADAGIYQNSDEVGRAAVQLLISLINHNERGIPEICREVLVEGRWVNGKTLPPKRS